MFQSAFYLHIFIHPAIILPSLYLYSLDLVIWLFKLDHEVDQNGK